MPFGVRQETAGFTSSKSWVAVTDQRVRESRSARTASTEGWKRRGGAKACCNSSAVQSREGAAAMAQNRASGQRLPEVWISGRRLRAVLTAEHRAARIAGRAWWKAANNSVSG